MVFGLWVMVNGEWFKNIMDYKDLDVWKKVWIWLHRFYTFTTCFHMEEKYGLMSQMRRAAVSIPYNIAEGAARKSDKEFIPFLMIGLGSLSELKTQYLISQRLKFLANNKKIEQNLEAVKRLGFRNYLIKKVKK